MRNATNIRMGTATFALSVALAACSVDDERSRGEDDEIDDVDETAISLDRKREVSNRIKVVVGNRGLRNALLYAGVPNHETGLVQCYADAPHHCAGPYSDYCEGPVLAGSGDGPCGLEEGGLGMYQFDAGTHADTVAQYGSGILSLDGNIDQGVSTIIGKVRSCSQTPAFGSDAEAAAWIEGATPGTADYETFLTAMAACYNGCGVSCTYANCNCDHEERRQFYRSGVEELLEAFGHDYWYGAGAVGASRTADVYVLQRHGGSEKTEVHVLAAADGFESFSAQVATVLHPTDEGPYELGVGDFDGDGHHDVYLITRRGGSGMTEVHVLDAVDGFQSYLVNSATALHPTDEGPYEFGIGDFDGDGRDDVYVINRRGAEGKTEVHVLDAADDFHRFSLHSATALHRTDEGAYDFVVGDYNGDGRDDLYFINRSGAEEKTEVHVLDAADDFHGFSLHSATALHRTDAGPYEFGAGDYDGDGRDDVYLINRVGSSGTTEVHVLDAASDFQAFSLQTATALHPTDSELYEFGIGAL